MRPVRQAFFDCVELPDWFGGQTEHRMTHVCIHICHSRGSGNPAFSFWTTAPRFRGDKFIRPLADKSRCRGDIVGFLFSATDDK